MIRFRTIIVVLVAIIVLGRLAWIRFSAPVHGIVRESDSPAMKNSIEAKQNSARLDASDTTIQFELTPSNNISVPVEINGLEPINLMFHTAVDSISLTTSAAKRLKLSKSESVDIESWGGTNTSWMSKGNRVRIGSLEWKNQVIFVDELSGPGTDGKFGPNLFSDKVLQINFDRSELEIHNTIPQSVLSEDAGYCRLEFVSRDGSMYVVGELTIGEQKLQHQFMLHSGFGGSLLLDDEFVREHRLASSLETISERELQDSFGNILKTKKVKLTSFDIGGASFSDLPVEIFDGAIGQQKVSVLGGELLKQFNLVIDAANHHIYLSKRSLFRTDFEDQRKG